MESKLPAVITGTLFYALGAITVNFFLPEIWSPFFFHPAVELLAASLGVFMLSALFYGKSGFVAMFLAGIMVGGSYGTIPLFPVAALMPLLLGMIGGSVTGKSAMLDLRGKKNFFDEAGTSLKYVLLAIVTSIAIGMLFGQEAGINFS